MSSAAVNGSAGCFGKVPQLGDFINNRLPRRFIEPWDLFLRAFLAESRQALGEAWLDAYLNGPIWHFALPPGLAGEDAVAGTLMPSVDRVGRYFPLTIALVVDKVPESLGDPWFERAEMLSLDALGETFDPAALDDRLARLGSLEASLAAPPSGALWTTFGSGSVPPLALVSNGLPCGCAATALLDGDCARWGWDAKPLEPATSNPVSADVPNDD